MRIYLSGPMSGLPDHNYTAFSRAATKLRGHGYIVYNPAENFAGHQGLPRSEYMRLDLAHVQMADAVFVLPDWRYSVGARLEVAIAQELGIAVYEYHESAQALRGDAVTSRVATQVEREEGGAA